MMIPNTRKRRPMQRYAIRPRSFPPILEPVQLCMFGDSYNITVSLEPINVYWHIGEAQWMTFSCCSTITPPLFSAKMR